MERTNNVVTVPNAKISAAIVNYYYIVDPIFSILVPVCVCYDSDLDHVERVSLDVANKLYNELECINTDYKPTIRFREFADSSVNFFIYFQGKEFGDHNTILNAFIKALHKRFKEENIEIPYPIRTVIHKNEIKN